jgi:hypothetical protein
MDQQLDLSVPLCSPEGYVQLKGKAGTLQRLWGRYCGLRLRISKLQDQLAEVEQKLIQEDPSFLQTRRTLVGAASFPVRPELEERPSPEVAYRNAIILKYSSLTAKVICKKLDSYGVEIPETWRKDFQVSDWQKAYANRRCRPRVEKLISEVKALGRLR